MRRKKSPIRINAQKISGKTHHLDPLEALQLDTFYHLTKPPRCHHVEVISAAHASRVGAWYTNWALATWMGWHSWSKRSSSRYHQPLPDYQIKLAKSDLLLQQLGFPLKFANRFPTHFASNRMCFRHYIVTIWPNINQPIYPKPPKKSPPSHCICLSVELLKPMSSLDWKDKGRWKS